MFPVSPYLSLHLHCLLASILCPLTHGFPPLFSSTSAPLLLLLLPPLFSQIGLVLFLYVAGLPQPQQQQYDAVQTSDVVASPASPRSEAAARH
jgi:hypothetical protein